MNTNTVATISAIVIYLLAMLMIGVYFSKKNKTSSDFFLGGRKLGPFVTAMSAEASDMSSWLLMGLPGLAYLSGLAEAFYTALGLAIGTYFNWLIVSKRIRVYSQHINAITVPDFFSKRYHEKKHVLESLAALIIIIFFIPYTAAGFAACGKLFNSMLGLDYEKAMVISALVIIFYTSTGGFMAASATDLIQGLVMTVALFIVIIYGTNLTGGHQTIVNQARQMPGFFSLNHTFNRATGQAEPYSALSIFSMIAWGLGYFGMPHILLRFMAIEDKEKLKLSRRVAMTWVLISLAIAVAIGIMASGMTEAGQLPYLAGNKSETAIVRVASLLADEGVGRAFLAGIIVACILAATMSTADSQLLAASSAVSTNLMQNAFGIKMSEDRSIRTARVTTLLISFFAILLARNPNSSIFEIVSFAWAGFGATFGPIVILSLFWKNSNMYGALAGMVSGAGMIFIWKYLVAPLGGLWNIYELLPAFILALVVNILVSLATGGASQEIKEEFREYQEVL